MFGTFFREASQITTRLQDRLGTCEKDWCFNGRGFKFEFSVHVFAGDLCNEYCEIGADYFEQFEWNRLWWWWAFSHDAENTKPDEPLYLPPWKYAGGKHLEENFMETVASWPESKLHHSQPQQMKTIQIRWRRKRRLKPKRSGHWWDSSHAPSSTNEIIKKESSAVTLTQRRSWFLNPSTAKPTNSAPTRFGTFDFNNQYVDLTKM